MRFCVFLRRPCADAACASAADESPVQQSYVETKDLKLVYYDFLDYLVPYAVRTFTSSLAWQRKMFGWVPSESTTVLLQDFADVGNAHQYSAPRNKLVVDVAPISHAFETFPGDRAHVLPDEPRDGPRGDRRHGLGGGPALAALLPRQGHAARAEPRNAAVQLPHDSALQHAAMVERGRRGLPRDLDERRPGPRAGWLRRDGVAGDGARRRLLLRSARASRRARSASTSSRARTRTSTEPASSPISRTPIRPKR